MGSLQQAQCSIIFVYTTRAGVCLRKLLREAMNATVQIPRSRPPSCLRVVLVAMVFYCCTITFGSAVTEWDGHKTGTYTLTDDIDVNLKGKQKCGIKVDRTLNITGTLRRPIISSSSTEGVLFCVGEDDKLILVSVTLKSTEVYGGVDIVNSARLLASSCVFKNLAGAIKASQNAHVSLVDSEILQNNAAQGDGIHATNSIVTLERTSVRADGTTTAGGSIFATGALTTITLRESDIRENAKVLAEASAKIYFVNVNVDVNGMDQKDPSRGDCGDELCQFPFGGDCTPRDPQKLGVKCDCSNLEEAAIFAKDTGQVVCKARPQITHVFPNNGTSIVGHSPITVCGNNFGSIASNLTVHTHEQSWAVEHRYNITCFRARAPPSFLGRIPLVVTVLEADMVPNAEYQLQNRPTVLVSSPRPNITSVESPPFAGGSMRIFATGLGDKASISDNTMSISLSAGGCPQICQNPRDGGNGSVLCNYNYPGTKGACKLVVLSVGPAAFAYSSKPFQFCYEADKGQIALPAGKQTVNEGQGFEYEIGPTLNIQHGKHVHVSVSAISSNNAFECIVSPVAVVMYFNTTYVPISVNTTRNDIDEGTDAVVYTCSMTHRVVQDEHLDASYRGSPDRRLELNVINDDNADVALWTIDSDGGFEYSVNIVSFYAPEGTDLQYGVGLTTRPQFPPIYVDLELYPAKIGQVATVTVNNTRLVFDDSNWHVKQKVVVSADINFVANAIEEVSIKHTVSGNDNEVIVKKMKNKDIIARIRIGNDDTASIYLKDSKAIVISTLEDSKYIEIDALGSQPMHNVSLGVVLPEELKPYVTVEPSVPVIVPKDAWRKVNRRISLTSKKGTPAGTYVVYIRPRSVDPTYNYSMEFNPLEVGVSVVVQSSLTPGRPLLTRGANLSHVHVIWKWDHPTDPGEFEVQWYQGVASGGEQFADGGTSQFTLKKSASLITKVPLSSKVLFVRVKTINGQWSSVTPAWKVAADCDLTNQYLSTKGTFSQWKCMACPQGASCSGQDYTWKDVRPKFGYWRNEVWSEDNVDNREFTKCVFPPACLGAENPDLEGLFVDEGQADPARRSWNESCNVLAGYANKCSPDGVLDDKTGRCRLCGTCVEGFRKLGVSSAMQCKRCPSKATNVAFLVAGGVVVVVVVIILVLNHIKDGGERSMNDMRKIIILNYFQLAYMLANMDIHWPEPFLILFDIQGAVSTIGEQLLNPACELSHTRAVVLLYFKHAAYLFVWPALICLTKGTWRLLACCQGRPYRFRGKNNRSPSHHDGSVATMVFLAYLLYPTLCSQAFALLMCKTVNNESYLVADLQEPCWEGRHRVYFLLLSVPQIIGHVIGIPLLGMWLVSKTRNNQSRLPSDITLFRYGMLFSAYKTKRWYWGATIASRKAVIAFMTSLLSNAALEVHWIILFLAFSIMLQVFYKPYSGVLEGSRELQYFDLASLFVLLITAWSGLFFNLTASGRCDSTACISMMICILCINIAFFAFCLYSLREYAFKVRDKCKSLVGRGNDEGTSQTNGNKGARESIHRNPLKFRKSLNTARGIFSMNANPISGHNDGVELLQTPGGGGKPNRNAFGGGRGKAKKAHAKAKQVDRAVAEDETRHSRDKSDWFEKIKKKKPNSKELPV